MAFLKRFPWLTFTSNAGKVLAVNAGETDFELVTATGDASGAVGDLVGVHFTASAEIVA